MRRSLNAWMARINIHQSHQENGRNEDLLKLITINSEHNFRVLVKTFLSSPLPSPLLPFPPSPLSSPLPSLPLPLTLPSPLTYSTESEFRRTPQYLRVPPEFEKSTEDTKFPVSWSNYESVWTVCCSEILATFSYSVNPRVNKHDVCMYVTYVRAQASRKPFFLSSYCIINVNLIAAISRWIIFFGAEIFFLNFQIIQYERCATQF